MGSHYRQFSSVAMAAEVLESRWTLLIVRELCLGSKHFNDIRKGVPKMSPYATLQTFKRARMARYSKTRRKPHGLS
jgi:DNA-binding HxlR family transcriptional regulator